METCVDDINQLPGEQVAGFMQVIGRIRWSKTSGVAESLDWAMSLMALHADHLEPEAVTETLGAILKDRDDVNRLAGARAESIVGELTSLDEEGLRNAPAQIAQRVDKELVSR